VHQAESFFEVKAGWLRPRCCSLVLKSTKGSRTWCRAVGPIDPTALDSEASTAIIEGLRRGGGGALVGASIVDRRMTMTQATPVRVRHLLITCTIY